MRRRAAFLLLIIGSQIFMACGLATPAAPSAQPTAGTQAITVYTAHEEETLKIYGNGFYRSGARAIRIRWSNKPAASSNRTGRGD